MSHYEDYPLQNLIDVIDRAIEEGKLYELIFTENGRKLWSSWSEAKIKELVKERIRKYSRKKRR